MWIFFEKIKYVTQNDRYEIIWTIKKLSNQNAFTHL